MKFGKWIMLAVLLVPVFTALGDQDERAWRRSLIERLPLYGQGNWIVIADGAFPALSREGVETFDTREEALDVLGAVLADIGDSKNIKPIIYTAAELAYVEDKDAPGIALYRDKVAKTIGERSAAAIPHQDIMAKQDAASKNFRMLILKSRTNLPYGAVYIQLESGYWNADADRRVHAAMAADKK